MKILAIDFSASLRGVALADVDDGFVQILGRAEERQGQGTRAFAMIDDVLKQAGLARGAIDCLAIGLGPGSYAGIRVSLAIAQGWQLATEVKTLGVSSMACLAGTAWAQGVRGATSFVIDAQRGEFYLADHQLDDIGCRETRPLQIVARVDVEQRLAAGLAVLGPDATAAFPGARNVFPDAGVLAGIAARRPDFISAAELEPIYLRAANFVKAPRPVRLY